MRILWLKSDLLLPLDKGGRLRTWHLMRHLAMRHDITYLSFADARQPETDIDGMRTVATQVETIRRYETSKRSPLFYAEAAMHVLDPLPYAVGKYRSRAFRSRLRRLLANGSCDLVVCDFLPPAVNLPAALPCPAVLFTHNVESEIWRRHVETASGPIARRLLKSQYTRMLRFEGRILRRFDGVLAVSDADRATFERLYGESLRRPIEVIPTGVDTEYFAPQAANGQGKSVVFTGSMDWLPNEDAMLHFCRDILPLIRAEVPDVTLAIVGRAPTPAVQKLGSLDGVTVTGRVDDVRPFVSAASVYVVPLRIGGGTRLKIFEAMAMGRAVVSTTVGAEGLPVVDGQHLQIADPPERFARAVIELLRNRPRANALGTAARALVVKHYDWSAVAGSLESALVRVVTSAVPAHAFASIGTDGPEGPQRPVPDVGIGAS